MRTILSLFAIFFGWFTSLAQIPPLVMPEGVGVNIHFVTGHERDLDMIKDAGFKFIRMDFSWESTERTPGKYNFSEYDDLIAHLKQRGIRAMFILDYSNPAYEKDDASPRHPESVAAFAQWSAAAAQHFAGQHIIWEIFNEPNGGFWHPKPDAHEYSTLALATAKAIREAEPNATVVGPALSGFEWDYMKVFLASGVLQYLDAVSVHPYRDPSHPPETAGPEYEKLRDWIDRAAPPDKKGKIPILSGEWGYSSNTKGVSLETQAQYAVRQQLFNFANGIPLSIWYDWKNDGPDPAENEHNFGTVTQNLEPKPAYLALQKMTQELSGYKIEERLAISNGDDAKDFAYLFYGPHEEQKIVAWTSGRPLKDKISRDRVLIFDFSLHNMPVYRRSPPIQPIPH